MKQHSRFTKRLLPSCIAAVAFGSTGLIAQVAHAQDDSGMIEEVVVTGIRSSLTRSVDVKRNAASVVDAISAEDIGKLPDTTIADSLQRVPGIQIRRSAGEGSTVNVRGMPQVSTLLNGEQFLSAGSITTAQPDFTDIPAELMSRVDVLKSAEAKTLAAGVAGTIDLKTRRPMDLDGGWTFAGAAEASQGSYTDDDTGHKLSGFVGFNNEDNFGALFSVSSSDVTLANYRYGMYSDWWFRGYNEDDAYPGQGEGLTNDLTGDGDFNDQVFGTIDYGVTSKITERERLGVSGTMQFQVNDSIELLADVFYTKMEQGDFVNGLIADNSWYAYDWVTPGEEGLINRGASHEVNGGSGKDFYTSPTADLDALRVVAKGETQLDDRESLNVNLQANLQFTDKFSGTFRYVHGEAENLHTGSFADALLTSGMQSELVTINDGVKVPANPGGYGYNGERVPVHFDFTGKHPSIQYPAGFGQSMSEYGLVSAFSHQNRKEESELDVLRFDGKYEADNGLVLDFGYRWADREVIRNQYDLVAPYTTDDADGNQVTVYSKWKDSGLHVGGDTIFETYSFDYLDSLGYITQVSDFGPGSDGNSYYFVDAHKMADTEGFHEALYPGNVKRKDGSQSYVVGDETHTAYFQGAFEGEWILPYYVNFGVQYIETNLSVTQFIPSVDGTRGVINGEEYRIMDGVAPDITGTEVIERSYDDWLPRLNIAIDTSDNTKVRLAYTKTMTQLDANDLGLGLVYTTNNNPALNVFQVVSGSKNGNPYMEPWRADNFDASFEWYFSDSGMLSVGLFHVDVETAIATSTVQVDAPADSDGVVRNDGTIDLTIRDNTDGGAVKGVELGYQQAFDFLPGAWGGLGTTINYTYTEGEGGETDFYGATMPMADNSENQVNAVLWYEYDRWQARLAYNYRSERFIGKSWNDGSPAAWWQAPTEYIDASISYDINDNVTVYLQGTNITEEFEETYMQWSDVKVNQNVYEARYALGVRAKF